MADAVSSPDPVQLARSGNLETLEQLWLDEMSAPGDLTRYKETLRTLAEGGHADRASVLAGMLVESLDQNGREADVLPLLETLAALDLEEVAGIEELCAKHVRAGFGDKPWFDFVLSKAGVSLDRFSWQGFLDFQKCSSFLPGRVVLHRSGWGEGEIAELHPDRDEVEIHFASGKQHTVPWQSAVDTMDPLPTWDIRAMRLTDPEGLLELAKSDPVEVLRRALKIYRGKSNATQVKELLHERVIPARSWATWWKKAKAAAVEDPLIAVEGSATRPTFTLRRKAVTLCEEARIALQHENRVEQMLGILRSYMDRATRDSDLEELGEFARERLGGLAAAGSPDADGVQALLFLEEIGQATEEQAAELIAAYMRHGASEGPYDLALLAHIPDSNLRCRIVRLLPRIQGTDWPGDAASQLTRIPDECEDSLELLVDLIREHEAETGAADSSLIDVHESIAPFPARHPFLTYLLTRAYAEGSLTTETREVDPNVACRVIMHVLRVVSDTRTARARRSRIQSRILTVLMGRKGLLRQLLEAVDERTIDSTLKIARGGGEDFPTKVQELVERVVRERFPELLKAPERPFWEDEAIILCTRPGFEAREGEFHHLRDDLIPKNSEAIGAAASYGDLSENAEWEAALEEQRNLTARASEYEDELKRASFLEEVTLPDGVVAPGTKVRLIDIEQQQEKTLRVLGPWDSVLGDDVVSYKAPLAAGLLGHAAGDEVVIDLPSGSMHVRVLTIEKLF